MVQMYTIAGRQVGSHVLAIAVLGSAFAGTAYALRPTKKPDNSPPINAKNEDEEKFVQAFIKAKEAEKSKH